MKKIFCLILMIATLTAAFGCGKKETADEIAPPAPEVETPAVPDKTPETEPSTPDAPAAKPDDVPSTPEAGKPVNPPSKPDPAPSKPTPKPDPAPSKPAPTPAPLSASDIVAKVVANYKLPALMAFDAETVASLYGIDTTSVKSYCVKGPTMDVKANEIAVFELSSASDAATFKKACEKRSKELAKTFEHYAADQFEIASAPSIVASGNYVFMAISENASSMASDFKKLVK